MSDYGFPESEKEYTVDTDNDTDEDYIIIYY
jgi:hypothetical protein